MKSIIGYLENEETKRRIIKVIRENLYLYQCINTEEKIQSLTGSLYNYLVMECVQNNQYVSLSTRTINALNTLYREFILQLRAFDAGGVTEEKALEAIVQKHREKLISVLKKNTYNKNLEQLFIPCAEYSGSFQFSLLHLQDRVLKQPILDLGCGKNHELLSYLKNIGYEELYGIDQYFSNEHQILCGNWFDHHFLPETWGTVIAHMSFSNHFRRSIINHDSDQTLYTNTYREILCSLLVGGCFIYSPAVRSVEETLDTQKYSIEYFPNLDDRNLDSVCITRKCR